ncbi:MAG: DHH family phosphoesterase [bacterium]
MVKKLTDSLKRLIKTIRTKKNIVVATHIDPDCDGICSALAMAKFVGLYKKNRPSLFCYSVIPPKYKFLLEDYQFTKIMRKLDLLIAVDSADRERIFPARKFDLEKILKNIPIINIDHHKTDKPFGTIAIIDENASSTCEIIYKILKSLNLKIDKSLAQIIYAGIYNETGGFVYPNTTADALRICADLIDLNIEPAVLAKRLNAKTVAGTKLLSRVLQTIRISNGIGTMYLSQKMLKKSKARMYESENFISFLQAIENVRVSLFFREETNEVRISLRSDGIIDVNEFARKFGGGGHRLAAGIRIKGNLCDIMQKITKTMHKTFKNANNK